MSGIVTLEELKSKLGIPDTVTKNDLALQCAIDALMCEILGFLCLEQCEPMDYVLIADLDCPPFVCPPDTLWSEVQPVIAIVEVDNGGCILDSTKYRWWKKDSSIKIICGHWAEGGCCSKPVKVTVTAGIVPTSNFGICLKNAMLQQLAASWKGPNGLLKKETIGRYSYELASSADRNGAPAHWVQDLWTVLQPFYRIAVGDLLTQEC